MISLLRENKQHALICREALSEHQTPLAGLKGLADYHPQGIISYHNCSQPVRGLGIPTFLTATGNEEKNQETEFDDTLDGCGRMSGFNEQPKPIC